MNRRQENPTLTYSGPDCEKMLRELHGFLLTHAMQLGISTQDAEDLILRVLAKTWVKRAEIKDWHRYTLIALRNEAVDRANSPRRKISKRLAFAVHDKCFTLEPSGQLSGQSVVSLQNLPLSEPEGQTERTRQLLESSPLALQAAFRGHNLGTLSTRRIVSLILEFIGGPVLYSQLIDIFLGLYPYLEAEKYLTEPADENLMAVDETATKSIENRQELEGIVESLFKLPPRHMLSIILALSSEEFEMLEDATTNLKLLVEQSLNNLGAPIETMKRLPLQIEEIAEIMGISPAYVHVIRSRAKAHLRNSL